MQVVLEERRNRAEPGCRKAKRRAGKASQVSSKYIHYGRNWTYAVYYRSNRTIYYNLDFIGGTQIIAVV